MAETTSKMARKAIAAKQLETEMRKSLSSRMIAEFSSLKRVLLIDRGSGLKYVRQLPQHTEILVSLLVPDLLKIKKEQMNYYEEVIEGDVTAEDLQRALHISQAEALIINIDEVIDEQKQQIIKLLADHPDYNSLSVIVVSCTELAKANQPSKSTKRGIFAKFRGSTQLQPLEEEGEDHKNKTTAEEAFSATPEILTRTTIIYATTPEAQAALEAANNPRSSKRISPFRFSSKRPENNLITITGPAETATDETSSLSKASWTRKRDQTDSLVSFIFSEIDDPRYQGCRITCVCTGMEMTVPTSVTTTGRTARTLRAGAR